MRTRCIASLPQDDYQSVVPEPQIDIKWIFSVPSIYRIPTEVVLMHWLNFPQKTIYWTQIYYKKSELGERHSRTRMHRVLP